MSSDEISKSLNVSTLPKHLDQLEGAGVVVADRSQVPAVYVLDRDAVRRELDVYSRYLLGKPLATDDAS